MQETGRRGVCVVWKCTAQICSQQLLFLKLNRHLRLKNPQVQCKLPSVLLNLDGIQKLDNFILCHWVCLFTFCISFTFQCQGAALALELSEGEGTVQTQKTGFYLMTFFLFKGILVAAVSVAALQWPWVFGALWAEQHPQCRAGSSCLTGAAGNDSEGWKRKVW